MENTLENKDKFFAQYWGQDIYQTNGGRYIIDEECFPLWIKSYLELKPISSITDEDAISLGFVNSRDFLAVAAINQLKDELRLLGYAILWNGLSVEEQINRRWIKLIQ